MKNFGISGLRVLGVIFVFMTGSSVLFAGGDVTLENINDGDVTAIYCSSNEPAHVDIRIENVRGDMVFYSEREKNIEVYTRFFKFTNMKDGEYRVIATIDGEENIHKFSVVDSRAVIGVTNIKANKHELMKVDNYLVCRAERGDARYMSLSIYENGYEIFKDYPDNEADLNRKYDLSELPSGEYSVNLTIGREVVRYNLLVD